MTAATSKDAHIWDRDPLDWYVEPPAATEALVSVEAFAGAIHDPCCGGGNIVKALIEAGYSATGSDVMHRVAHGDPAPWFQGLHDFLAFPGPASANMVMNPPFFRAKGAEAFIRKAIAETERKVCAFVDIRFIAGAERASGLFREHPPTRIWVVTPRVSCPPGAYLAAGNKAGNGSSDWCWLVWDKQAASTETSFGWLRRNRDNAAIAADQQVAAE